MTQPASGMAGSRRFDNSLDCCVVTGPGNRRGSDPREQLPMVERLHGQVESAAAWRSDSSAPWIGLPRMGYKIVKRAGAA